MTNLSHFVIRLYKLSLFNFRIFKNGIFKNPVEFGVAPVLIFTHSIGYCKLISIFELLLDVVASHSVVNINDFDSHLGSKLIYNFIKFGA